MLGSVEKNAKQLELIYYKYEKTKIQFDIKL